MGQEVNQSRGESVKHGGGKTSDLLYNELWRRNTDTMDGSVTQEKNCIHALNRTTDLL